MELQECVHGVLALATASVFAPLPFPSSASRRFPCLSLFRLASSFFPYSSAQPQAQRRETKRREEKECWEWRSGEVQRAKRGDAILRGGEHCKTLLTVALVVLGRVPDREEIYRFEGG